MPILKDLLPCLTQLAVPCVLLPMDLQAGLRGLITQVKYLPQLPTKLGCVTSVAHIIVPSCTEHAA